MHSKNFLEQQVLEEPSVKEKGAQRSPTCTSDIQPSCIVMLRRQYAQTSWCFQRNPAHLVPEALAPPLQQNGRLCQTQSSAADCTRCKPSSWAFCKSPLGRLPLQWVPASMSPCFVKNMPLCSFSGLLVATVTLQLAAAVAHPKYCMTASVDSCSFCALGSCEDCLSGNPPCAHTYFCIAAQ